MILEHRPSRARGHTLPRRAIVALIPAVASATVLTGCNSTPKAIVKTVPGPTVTVTVPGPTATVTKTVKVKVKPSPVADTMPGTPTVAATPQSAAAATVDSSFDRAYAIQVAGEIIGDIKTVDHRLHDGIAVSSGLVLLSEDYGRLADDGTPPGIAAKRYQPRLSTLGSFASTAADEYDANPMEGQARYEVVRKETGPLFTELNTSLGTHFALP